MALRRTCVSWAVALSALLLCVALPAAARADHGTPFLDDGLATYFGIAQAHWGGQMPTCVENGVIRRSVHAVLYDDPEPGVAARAEQPGCRIWLDRGAWRALRAADRCMIVVHEWGHLTGLGHAEDPLDLMAEFPSRRPAACAGLVRAQRRAPQSARGSARSGRRRCDRGSPRRRFGIRRPGRATRRFCIIARPR